MFSAVPLAPIHGRTAHRAFGFVALRGTCVATGAVALLAAFALIEAPRHWGSDASRPHTSSSFAAARKSDALGQCRDQAANARDLDVAAAMQDATPVASGLRACLRGELCTAAAERASAANLLATFTAERANVDALVAACLDGDAVVRAASVGALAYADTTRRAVAHALYEAAEDSDPSVRRAAATALRGVDPTTLAAVDRMAVEYALAEWSAASAGRTDVDTATADAATVDTASLARSAAAASDTATTVDLVAAHVAAR